MDTDRLRRLMSDDDGKIIDALEKKPEKTWASYLFGIQRGDGSTRNPGSKLILVSGCNNLGSHLDSKVAPGSLDFLLNNLAGLI